MEFIASFDLLKGAENRKYSLPGRSSRSWRANALQLIILSSPF
jgi:hypothetical protein